MTIDRRSFVLAALGAASGLALAQPAVRRVGYLSGGQDASGLAKALKAHGWTEGANLRIEIRTSKGQMHDDSHDAAARELVALRPDLIVAFLGRAAAVARATQSIPIVAGFHDPVVEGFAASLARPGRNVTGITFGSPDGVKLTFWVMTTMLPGLKRIHALAARAFHETPNVIHARRQTTEATGLAFVAHDIQADADADRVLAGIRNVREEAIVLAPMRGFDYGAFAGKAARARVATLDTASGNDRFLVSGSMSHPDTWGAIASVANQVLRGSDPAVTPFVQPTHVELYVNRRLATQIGIAVPPEVLLRATKIID